MLREVSKFKKQRISELDVYKKVYLFYNGKSILTWKSVIKENVCCYAHLFPKWSYPSFRTRVNNIVLVASIEEHEIIDIIFSRIRDMYWNQKIFEMINEWKDLSKIIKEYYVNNFNST